MKHVLTQLLTGKDNQTHDIARWGGALVILVGLFLEVYSVIVLKRSFDLMQYGTGWAAVLGGIGMSVKIKENSEPSAGP